ncbi:unnamed protein product [Prorocentrum cordatum]|uniref:Uncharacterized protein n=1 Tax=Prorocentrum cordatum TaxID=2364126 RepID=A0ABN9SP62_9DINO|nr:unnamed protein product [Polarella glacialis]
MNLRISPPEHCQAKTGSGHRCSWEKHTRKARKEEGGGEKGGRERRKTGPRGAGPEAGENSQPLQFWHS